MKRTGFAQTHVSPYSSSLTRPDFNPAFSQEAPQYISAKLWNPQCLRTVELSMNYTFAMRMGAVLLLASLGGCDQLGMAKKAVGPAEVPSDGELQKISYMTTANSGPQGRKTYSHLWEAKTCADFETAMRWNRPPNVAGGPFSKQMIYLTGTVPADLPSDAEVFIVGSIEKGDPLVAGGEAWILKMHDGSLVQAAEMADFIQKQEQDTQGNSKQVALDKPNKPGRAFCGQAVYQGLKGKDPMQDEKKIPLFSMLYAIDREK
jgi:hypothetical protein